MKRGKKLIDFSPISINTHILIFGAPTTMKAQFRIWQFLNSSSVFINPIFMHTFAHHRAQKILQDRAQKIVGAFHDERVGRQ